MYCTTKFNIQKFCVLPTEYISVTCFVLGTKCDIFLKLYVLVVINDMGDVYCAVGTGRLLGVFAAFRQATLSFVTPVVPHGTTWLPLNGFSRNLILEGMLKICGGN